MLILSVLSTECFSKITLEMMGNSAVRKYHIACYSYHQQLIGHKDYGAPMINTLGSGGVVFGDGDDGSMLVKLDKNGHLR